MTINFKTKCIALFFLSTSPNVSNSEPLFNPTLTDNQIGSVGYFNSQYLKVNYKGIGLQNYTVSRDQNGLLLTFDSNELQNLFKRSVSDEPDTPTENDASENDASENDSLTENNNESVFFRTYYIHASVNDSAELKGPGYLNETQLTGHNHTFGVTHGFGHLGSGLFVFLESEVIEESISFVVNGQAVSGALEGSDFTIGIGASLSGGPRFALAGTASYTFSSLKFTRTLDTSMDAVDVPITGNLVGTVSRVDRASFGIMATVNVLPALHLSLHAVGGAETSATAMLRYSF